MSHDNDEKWASWGDDDEDDWAERVGEEDWTGRRIEARKEAVEDAWKGHSPNPHTVSVSGLTARIVGSDLRYIVFCVCVYFNLYSRTYLCLVLIQHTPTELILRVHDIHFRIE